MRLIVFTVLLVLFLPLIMVGFTASLMYTMLECGWLVWRRKVWEGVLE